MATRCVRLVLTLVVVCGFLLRPAAAQVRTGTILGTVTDQSQGVLPGVTATLTSPALPGGPVTTVTDVQGRYRFPELQPGTYTVKLSLSGFADYAQEQIRVAYGSNVEINVSMKVATVAETITVSGQAPM